MEQYLTIGKIIDSHGLDGSVKVYSTSTNIEMRYKKGNVVFITIENEEKKNLTIQAVRFQPPLLIVKFKEINNANEAHELKGKELLVVKDYNDLKEGYYFYSDLKGCSIISEGETLGKVIEVEEFPAQLTLRVKRENGKTFFVPFLEQFIKSVDIDKKEIEINFMEGML